MTAPRKFACPGCGSTDVTFDFNLNATVKIDGDQIVRITINGFADAFVEDLWCKHCGYAGEPEYHKVPDDVALDLDDLIQDTAPVLWHEQSYNYNPGAPDD